MKKKSLLSLILAVVMAFSFAACSSNTFTPAALHVNGKRYLVDMSPAAFSPIFPVLGTEWDGKDMSKRPVSQTMRSESTEPYYELDFRSDEDDYAKGKVYYFMAANGKPGDVEMWGITFDMDEAAVSDAIEKIEKESGAKIEPAPNQVSGDPVNAMRKSLISNLNIPEGELSITKYAVANYSLYVAFRDGKVCSMLLEPWRVGVTF